MFINAHIYFSIRRSNGTTMPMRVLGSILPDSALTGTLGWADLHSRETIEDLRMILGESEAAWQLIAGLIDHYDLDQRSHEGFAGEGGYAFSHQTPELVDVVAQACGLENPEKSRAFAHNFIEMGVDVNLLNNNPAIQEQGREALRAADMTWVAEGLSAFLKSNTGETTARLEAFLTLAMKYDLRKIGEWTPLWADVTSLLLGHAADTEATHRALLMAAALTADDWRQVLSV